MFIPATPEQRPVVLVVEDEYWIRMAAAEELRERGFDAIEARDADDALRLLKARHVDAVFSDITMPGSMDGIGLAKWVREHKPGVKVVLTSGRGPVPRESEGFGPVIDKPYRYDDVAKTLLAAIVADRGSRDAVANTTQQIGRIPGEGC